MRLQWSSPAKRDLVDFLRKVSPRAAVRILGNLGASAEILPEHPRIGHIRDDYAPREVRSLITGDYEIQQEVVAGAVIIQRLWHTR